MLTAEARQENPLERAAETLDWIGSLQDNWDEEGAPAFPPALIEMAREILEILPRVPFIAPTGRESIQMEYEDESLGYLEFELFPSGELKEFFQSPSRESFTRSIAPSDLQEEVELFYGSRLQSV